jgi:peptidyl-prolyl cis-trans isomerase B (cyclophilin B)
LFILRPSTILLGALLLAALVGCKRGGPPRPEKKADTAPTAKEEDPAVHRLKQTFEEAMRKSAPGDAPKPPDMTITGKSVGKVYADVVLLWKDISYTTADGKRIEYSAALETDLGTIEMALLSDAAPNHVRNFVALARAGYYDGLSFDHIRHEEIKGPDGYALDLVEGGDPLGANDLEDHFSIGYWLNPEIDPKSVHDAGSVGAIHGAELDTAGCKFYIVLGKAPLLDGNYTIFAKVTKGLDIVRKIHEQPAVELEEETGYSRPLKPVIIRKVTIQTHEIEAPASGDNKQQ